MAAPETITVLGIAGETRDDLPPGHLRRILGADLLIASERHLLLFPEFSGDTLAITSNVKEVATLCAERVGSSDVVVLGSGDPNFFGIGRYLVAKLGADRVRIEPAVSSMQEAFARVGLPWHEAAFGSCHGKPIEGVIEKVREHPVVGLFTDPTHTPSAIARALLDAGLPDLKAWVCGNLGLADETVFSGRLSAVLDYTAPALNILIVAHDGPPRRPLLLGMPERDFVHRKPKAGLITRREIRAVAISKLNLTDRSVVWDIGAGSGSVAVECALVARRGQVFAVEKNAEDVANVAANRDRFGCHNLTPLHATAPDGLSDLPDPDAVFIGGTGKRLEALLATCLDRLSPGGRLVMTLATIDNLAAAYHFFRAREITPEVTQVQVSRGTPILDMTRLEALNPVTLLAVTRE